MNAYHGCKNIQLFDSFDGSFFKKINNKMAIRVISIFITALSTERIHLTDYFRHR